MAWQSREERARVRLDVACEESGRQVFFSTLNLSASGILLATAEPPELGREIHVVLSLPPDGLFLRMHGQVVRHASRREPSGFAVAFESLDQRTRADLKEFIRTLRASSEQALA